MIHERPSAIWTRTSFMTESQSRQSRWTERRSHASWPGSLASVSSIATTT